MLTKRPRNGKIQTASGFLLRIFAYGEMAEWSKAPVLKTGDVKASVGSNPTLSANFILFHTCGSTQVADGAPLLREKAVKSGARVQIPPSAPSQETEEPQRFPGFSCIHAGLRDLFYRLTVPILSRSFALLANESLTKFTRQVPQYIPCKVLTSAALSISIPPSQAIRLRRGYALSFLKKVPFL